MRGTVSLPFQYGSGSRLQCAAPLQYRSGPLFQCAVPPRYRFGTARVNARYRLGTASVPLGPSITIRGTASVPLRYRSGPLYNAVSTPRLRFAKFNWVGVKNFQEDTKTNRNPRNATLTASSNGALHTCAKAFQAFFALNHSYQRLGRGFGHSCIQRKIAFSGEFVAFILGSKNTSKNGLATEGLPSSRTCVDIYVQGVENKCSRRCKTMERPAVCKTFVAYRGNNRNLRYFSTGGINFVDKNGPRFGVRPNTSKSN